MSKFGWLSNLIDYSQFFRLWYSS